MKKLVLLLFISLFFSCNDSVNETEENENNPPNGEVHTLNYNVSSHDWNNYQAPWINLARITDSLGFSQNDSYNTNSAYADFNFDGFFFNICLF